MENLQNILVMLVAIIIITFVALITIGVIKSKKREKAQIRFSEEINRKIKKQINNK